MTKKQTRSDKLNSMIISAVEMAFNNATIEEVLQISYEDRGDFLQKLKGMLPGEWKPYEYGVKERLKND